MDKRALQSRQSLYRTESGMYQGPIVPIARIVKMRPLRNGLPDGYKHGSKRRFRRNISGCLGLSWIVLDYLGMDVKNFILRLGLLSAFLLSENGYAIPITMGLANSREAEDHGAGSISMAGANKSRPGSDEMQPFVRMLPWNAESLGISALLGKYHGPFDFLPEFHLPFGFSMQDGSMEKFIASAISGSHDDIVISGFGFDYDDMAMAEFFATLGIDIVDWRAMVENQHMSGHDAAPLSDGQTIARPGQRKECMQRQRYFGGKSELHDNDCFGEGGLANISSSAGRNRLDAIVNSNNANSNLRNNPVPAYTANSPGGGAPGGASGGITPTTSSGGDDGDKGRGSGSGSAPDTGATPGMGTGDGEIGGGGREVQPVPEPGTGVLLLLGFICMYCTRGQRRWAC